MNNSLSLQQISKTGNFDYNLIFRQNRLSSMGKYMQVKIENPQLKQSEIAKGLGCSSTFFKRYKNDINMVSPYKLQSNTTIKRSKCLKHNF